MVKLLLTDNLKKRDRTPLLYIAGNKYKAMVKLLLETGNVNINLVNQDGRTPLLYIVESRSEAIVKLLLETGDVDIDLVD
jgi:ankyrin repeat protein